MTEITIGNLRYVVEDMVAREIERLREAIKNLNALRRNDQLLTEKAEAALRRLVDACDIAEDVTDTIEYRDAIKLLEEKNEEK